VDAKQVQLEKLLNPGLNQGLQKEGQVFGQLLLGSRSGIHEQ
jgi:hypothetical protein